MGVLTRFVSFLGLISLCQACTSISLSPKYEFYESMDKARLLKLKMKGIYYSYRPKECYGIRGSNFKDYTDFFVFYENGYFFNYSVSGLVPPSELESSIKRDINDRPNEDLRKVISLWGPYVIRGDSLFLQKLGHEEHWITIDKKKAKIVNDSTLEFTEGFCLKDISQTKVFKFQRTKSKLDSTNSFMTNKLLIETIEAEKKRRREQ